ncbi:hypothetical protein CEP52_007211 [Fusarium oligoseptatum]|uniref:CHAT domain-containing protein n=1 Tax=Fusarium oligoseptatum TaxID=2604345 RepID=A0A428TP37_9HYPO|nr:hypothetical protein CEP52_007211 [Fusarium oligoseptatum]
MNAIPLPTWTSSPEEIENIVGEARRASASNDTPNRVEVLDRGGIALLLRYGHTLDLRDIEEAVNFGRMAVNALVSGDQSEGLIKSHLCSILLSWCNVINDFGVLDQALNEAYSHGIEAVQLLSHDKRAVSMARSLVCQVRLQQALRDGSQETLDRLIADQRDLVRAEHPDTKSLAADCSRLGVTLGERHNRTGSRTDLEEAIHFHYRAVELIQELDDADIWSTRLNLGTALVNHYRATGAYQSLDAAIQETSIVMKGYTPGRIQEDTPRNYALALRDHGTALEAKCYHFRGTDLAVAMHAIDEAIRCGQEALRRLDSGDGWYFLVLISTASWYGTKMLMTENSHWGDEGLKLLKTALGSQSKSLDHADLRSSMVHLLQAQFQFLKQEHEEAALEKLREAIRRGREAVEVSRPGDALLGERRLNVGKMLLNKFLLQDDENDHEEATKAFILAAKTENASLVVRIPAAMQGGLCLQGRQKYHEAHALFKAAIGLLSTNNLMALSTKDLHVLMRHVSGLGSFASSVALLDGQSPFEALRPLETARCVISELAMRNNIDLSELQLVRPDMAKEYAETSSRLRQTTNRLQKAEEVALSPGPLTTRQSLRELQQALLHSIQAQEEEIRTLEGFEHFQQPLAESDMKKLASDGPIIVVNVSAISSDAFVVTEKDITMIPLPGMKYNDLQTRLGLFSRHGNVARTAVPRIPEHLRSGNTRRTLSGALQWLWNAAVGLILEKTPLTETKRVWWITCGLAGRAPLHAAGNHSPGNLDNAISRVRSSYISSFKALRHARAQQKEILAEIFVLVDPDSEEEEHAPCDGAAWPTIPRPRY